MSTKDKKKQPLLQESVFRRFAQLSNTEALIKPLQERFYAKEEKVDESAEQVDEIETKNQARVSGETDRLYENEDLPPSDEEGGELPPPPPSDDLPPEGGEMGGGMEGEVEELVQVIAQALADKTGVDIAIDGQSVGGMGGEMGGEMPPDMGGEAPPEAPVGGGEELPPEDGEEEEMMETDRFMMEKGYVREGTGFVKAEGKKLEEAKKAFEEKMKESKKLQESKKVEEEETLEEDSAQEKAQGKPKPGTHEAVKGADKGETMSYSGGDDKPMKEAPKPKLPSQPVNESAIAKRVLQRLLNEIKARNVKLSPAEQKAALKVALEAKKDSLRKGNGSKKK